MARSGHRFRWRSTGRQAFTALESSPFLAAERPADAFLQNRIVAGNVAGDASRFDGRWRDME